MSREHPFKHGQLAYVQIPAADVSASAAFYKSIFGWETRGPAKAKSSGFIEQSFTDASGNIIGAFVTHLKPSPDRGAILYLYVHGLDATLDKMVAAGSRVVREPYLEGDLWVATLTDPAGNVIGIWQFDPR